MKWGRTGQGGRKKSALSSILGESVLQETRNSILCQALQKICFRKHYQQFF